MNTRPKQACIRVFERFDLPVSDPGTLSRLGPDLMMLFDDFACERVGMFLSMTSLIAGIPAVQLKLEMQSKTPFFFLVKGVNAYARTLGPHITGFTIEDLEVELKEGSNVERPKSPALLIQATRYLRVFDISPSYMFALYKMLLQNEKHFIVAVVLHLCLILDAMHRCDPAAHFEMEIEAVDEGEAVVGFEGIVWLGLLCSVADFKADAKATLFSNDPNVTMKHKPISDIFVDNYLGELYGISILLVRGLYKYPAWSPTATPTEISAISLRLLQILLREKRTFDANSLCQLRYSICSQLNLAQNPPMYGINHVVSLICQCCTVFTNKKFLDLIKSFLEQNLPLDKEPVEDEEIHMALETQKMHNMNLIRANHETSADRKDQLDSNGRDARPSLGLNNSARSWLDSPFPTLTQEDMDEDKSHAYQLPKRGLSSGSGHSIDVLAMHRLSVDNADRKSRPFKKHRNTSKLALKKKKKQARLTMRQNPEWDSENEMGNGAPCQEISPLETAAQDRDESGDSDRVGGWPDTADSLESNSTITEQEYSNLYYDELDEDEDFLDLVNMFSQMFRHISRQELKIKIKTAADYGDLLEELCVEDEHCELALKENMQDQIKIEQSLEMEQTLETQAESSDMGESNVSPEPMPDYSATAHQLAEIFPSYDLSVLEVVAVKHKHHLNKATEELLAEPSAESIMREAKQSNLVESRKDAWEAVLATADEVAKALRMKPEEVIGYVHTNKGNYYESLVAVIRALGGKTIADSKSNAKSVKPNVWDTKQPTPKPAPVRRRQAVDTRTPTARSVPIPLGGRVQGQRVQRGGARKRQDRVTFGAWNEDFEREVPAKSLPTPPLELASYVYDSSSEESCEIRAIYESNLEFRQISPQFAQETLAFFKGNVLQAVDILIALVSNNAACLTQDYKLVRSESKELKPSITIELAPRQTAYSLQAATNKFAQYLAKAVEATRVSTQQVMDVYERNGMLDLHGLSVLQALSVTHGALLQWWSAEQHKRVEQGEIHRYGTRAAFAGQVHVVTGRGLHSATGKSVIRSSVKKYLDRNGFSYAENLGSFVVKGRKSQHLGRGTRARDEALAIETFMF